MTALAYLNPASCDIMNEIDKIFGATLCGTVVTGWVVGLLCVFAYQYYMAFPKDPWLTKSLVGFLLFLQILNLIIITKMDYYYLITSFSILDNLGSANWEWSMFIGLSVISAFCVQIYYARRVFLLSRSFVFLISILLPAFGQLAFGLGTMIYTATLVEFDKFRAVTWICVAWLACSAACDLLIAGLQVMYLMKHRSPVTRTDILVKKLLFYIISTGSLTSVIVTIEFSSFAALGFNFAHVFLSYSAGGVYFLSLLANLLARREMQGKYTVSSDLPSASNIVPLSIRFRPGTPPSSKDDSLMTPLDSNVHPSHVDNGCKGILVETSMSVANDNA